MQTPDSDAPARPAASAGGGAAARVVPRADGGAAGGAAAGLNTGGPGRPRRRAALWGLQPAAQPPRPRGRRDSMHTVAAQRWRCLTDGGRAGAKREQHKNISCMSNAMPGKLETVCLMH